MWQSTELDVGLPNGHFWRYKTQQHAEKAALVARALAAMPGRGKPSLGHTNIGQYGQQSQLARELGYKTPNGKPDHCRVYNMLLRPYLPTGDKLEKLKAIAARVPDDWFEKCPCLLDEQKQHGTA